LLVPQFPKLPPSSPRLESCPTACLPIIFPPPITGPPLGKSLPTCPPLTCAPLRPRARLRNRRTCSLRCHESSQTCRQVMPERSPPRGQVKRLASWCLLGPLRQPKQVPRSPPKTISAPLSHPPKNPSLKSRSPKQPTHMR